MLTAVIEFLSSATKGFSAVAEFFVAASRMKTTTENFFSQFHHAKEAQDKSVEEVRDHGAVHLGNKVVDYRSITGELAPLLQLKKPAYQSFTDVSKAIKTSLDSRAVKSPIHDFLRINTLEWLAYGCSMQADCRSSIQLMMLVDNEEANSLPVAVSTEFFEGSYAEIMADVHSHTVATTGVLVSINEPDAAVALGPENVNLLKSGGFGSVLIPDERIIERLGIDFSYAPGVLFKKPTSCFLGFLWVAYIDTHTMNLCPIYEYGNLGTRESFELLSDKLINQIEFFKKKIWHDCASKENERRYRLVLAYSDRLMKKVSEAFGESSEGINRRLMLEKCRSWVVQDAFGSGPETRA